MKYYVGFDIGSDSVHAAVLDDKGEIVYSPDSVMHFGNPIDALRDVYAQILSRFGFDSIAVTAFTGSVGEFIAARTKMVFFYDTIAIPLGADKIAPDAGYVFHIGAKDPYFFEKERIKTGKVWKVFTPDHGTGTKCGGGSGILIAKQCRRFFQDEVAVKLGDDRKRNREALQEQFERMFERADKEIVKADKEIDVGGRCGVVIQSDMIHLQNSGEQIKNILKGMFDRIAKNYKCDVIRTRFLDSSKNAIATGGVCSNKWIIGMLERHLGVKIDVPENYQRVGAIGAALKAKEEGKLGRFKPEELGLIAEAQRKEIKIAPALSSVLDKVKVYAEEKSLEKKEDLIIYNFENLRFSSIDKDKKTDVLLGIDGGSTTTKAIIADANDLKIIAEICLSTNGKPLQAAQEMFRQIRDYIGDFIQIKGVAYTGSSGAFYYKLFTDKTKRPEIGCVDIVKDEITCHAYGVKHFNKNVDTIFELGGQDAKFTLFNQDGTVKKAKMNLSCMAGTGQTMHNMVEMVGLDIEKTFSETALKAKQTPIVDETCGVFTEAGISKLVALGFPKEEIAAAIAFGFMGGYVNKFVGNERFGSYSSAQGGPFKGLACLAALSLHTGMEVHAFPHRQLFGALGAAIAVYSEIKRLEGVNSETKFRGLEIADMLFEKRVENCSKIIKDNCGVRDCKLQVYRIGDDVIYSGGLCPKGNTDTSIKRASNYVELYKGILNKHLAKYSVELDKESNKERVLIPRSLTFLNEKGVFYSSLYNELGFDICISPESDDEIANQGIAFSHSETCYPIKLAHGHVSLLKKFLRKGKDKILLVNAIGADKIKHKFCPYVAGAGFLVKDALSVDNKDALLPVLHFNDPDYSLVKAIKKDLDRVYGKRFSISVVKRAVRKALKMQEEFLKEVYSKGKQIVDGLKKRDEKIFIGIGRGYTILDDKASSKVHELFASYGLHFIPSFFLRAPDIDIEDIAHNMYWYQGQSMIKYNLLVAMDSQLYVVRETNFNCGTDSMILYHEEEIMDKAAKPHLVLQTDGHNSNAQFGTRIMANQEVVKRHKQKPVLLDDFKIAIPEIGLKNRIIGIPYMGDSSNTAAAAFRALGYNAVVIPTQTKEAARYARKFVSTNTCRPFSFQIGDCLAWLHELKKKGIDPNKGAAVFQPKAKGPCRFGQYSVMLRKFFDECGFNNVPVINPDAEADYNDLPVSKIKLVKISSLFYKGCFCNDVLYDALLRTRPYEKEEGLAEKEYNELRAELYGLIEKGASVRRLAGFMQHAKKRFESVIGDCKRKPLVVMNGEIFVRCHRGANQESIKLLERSGLEVMLNPTVQWIDYTNKSSVRNFRETKEWKNLFVSLIKQWYTAGVRSRLYAPFADYLKERELHDPISFIEPVQRDLIYERLIGGESPLSIGEAYSFMSGHLNNLSGIYHVGPFGCMHETVASAKIQSLVQKQRLKAKEIGERIIPFMDAVFGDSELPNLEAEIAAFAEKCYLKKRLVEEEKIKN